MIRLTLTPRAEQELETTGDYIAVDNPARAGSFIRELRTQCQRIAATPSGYRLRPELGDDIRSCAHGNWVIFFVASPEEVTIIRLLHGGQNIPTALDRNETSYGTIMTIK